MRNVCFFEGCVVAGIGVGVAMGCYCPPAIPPFNILRYIGFNIRYPPGICLLPPTVSRTSPQGRGRGRPDGPLGQALQQNTGTMTVPGSGGQEVFTPRGPPDPQPLTPSQAQLSPAPTPPLTDQAFFILSSVNPLGSVAPPPLPLWVRRKDHSTQPPPPLILMQMRPALATLDPRTRDLRPPHLPPLTTNLPHNLPATHKYLTLSFSHFPSSPLSPLTQQPRNCTLTSTLTCKVGNYFLMCELVFYKYFEM